MSSTTEDRTTAATTTTTNPGRRQEASTKIDESILSSLSDCETGTSARKVLDLALLGSDENDDDDGGASSSSSSSVLYGSARIPRGASDRTISDADLAIQTNVRNSKYTVTDLIELNGDRDADRAALSLLCVTIAGSVSALIAQQNLPGPDIVRFLVAWALSFSPLAFVGVGMAIPSELQSFLVSVQRYAFPAYRKRMVQHEAGHFLLGHLLGMPIKGYRANAVRNAVEFYPLSDDDVGRDRAAMLGFDGKRNVESLSEEEYVEPTKGDGSFFGEGGRGSSDVAAQSVFRNAKNYTADPFLKLPSQNEPTNSWPYRGFDHDALDRLAVISVAGVCSEILAFGNAEGGYADLSQLRQLFGSAEPPLNEKEMDNRIRFALGYATSQLRLNLGALDALADVMARDGSVAECVSAIERCEDPTGAAGLLGSAGEYERKRREKMRLENVGWLERLALGGGKNVDAVDDGVVEGKGGGDRKPKFAMTGDDPLYAAAAASFAFFVWASNGGLSLH